MITILSLQSNTNPENKLENMWPPPPLPTLLKQPHHTQQCVSNIKTIKWRYTHKECLFVNLSLNLINNRPHFICLSFPFHTSYATEYRRLVLGLAASLATLLLFTLLSLNILCSINLLSRTNTYLSRHIDSCWTTLQHHKLAGNFMAHCFGIY